MVKHLGTDFYRQNEVVALSQQLLGKVLVTVLDGHRTAGKIVETEAYRAPDDKACHAHLNRYTERTKVMFEAGGVAYIYLCYGIHHLFNVVTGPKGQAHAILIRAIEPLEGLPLMLNRRGKEQLTSQLTAGPGVMSKALGLHKSMTGTSLVEQKSPIFIEDHGIQYTAEEIIASPRVGVDYAEECALWPWRFRIKNNRWTSKAK